MIQKFLCGALVAGAAISASAAPIQFDEAVSGDLTAPGSITVLTADAGSNVIKGSMVWLAQPDGSGGLISTTDLDPFELHLPAGMAITQASVTLQFEPLNANTISADLTFAQFNLQTSELRSTCFQLLGTSPCPNASPAGGSLFGGFPISSAVIISQGGGFNGADWSQDMGGTIRYTVSVEVQAVPEPTSAALLLMGALGLLGWRRASGRWSRR